MKRFHLALGVSDGWGGISAERDVKGMLRERYFTDRQVAESR